MLFANRVTPTRFVFSVLLGAVSLALGYGLVVVITWATFFLPGSRPVAFGALAGTIALSYAPLLSSFLAALPYVGNALHWALRVWQLAALVLGVAATAQVSFWVSAGHVGLGWIVMTLAQRGLGGPITKLGVRIANAVAGKPIVQESVAVRSVARDLLKAPHTARRTATPAAAPTKPRGTLIFTGIIVTFLAVTAIVVALTPLRSALLGPHTGAFWLRAGVNLAWLGVVAVVVAAFLAPLETLGWWAGWYGDEVRSPDAPAAPGKHSSRYIVYLDGISQSSGAYTPDIETFLDALEPELPAGVHLIRGLVAYSVLNRPLDVDPMYARFWKLVERWRAGAKTAFLGMFINIRNVMIVAVSADARYGPLYNLGIAQVVLDGLITAGYRRHSKVPITLLGYSGGGQMSAATAPLLKSALGAPVDVISLAGVMTGACTFQRFDHLYHMYGSRDVVEPLGPLMFASRWRIDARSNWNRALRSGKITITHLGPVGHQVPGGLLDPAYMLADGRSALRHTLDRINAIFANPAHASTSSPPAAGTA